MANDGTISKTDSAEHRVVSIAYVRAKQLPSDLIEANKDLKDAKYVEVRVINSTPEIKMTGVNSPARKVRDLILSKKQAKTE